MPRDRREELTSRFRRVRARTLALTKPLTVDDQLAQAFPDASPTKWHLGHTTWFFDRFVLAPHARGREPIDPLVDYVFNSYYEAVGPRQPRAERALAVRPTLDEVLAYRARIDDEIARFAASAPSASFDAAADALELGTHHEEQHQELLLTDVKAVLAAPHRARVAPADTPRAGVASAPPETWVAHDGGLVEIGWERERGFAFDNEAPRHRVWLEAFDLASRCVTAREYLEFVEDGGYANALLWLSDGWATSREQSWVAPRYWVRSESEGWLEHTLAGLAPLDLDAPVAHVSAYEADAYARWRGARLPTEAEWESVAASHPIEGNLLEEGVLHPRPSPRGAPAQLFGDVWEHTASAYAPYPRFRPFAGALAEYNGKFMVSQLVLRGGSCFTPREHLRATYRNFFPPSARWQVTGIRLARWR